MYIVHKNHRNTCERYDPCYGIDGGQSDLGTPEHIIPLFYLTNHNNKYIT